MYDFSLPPPPQNKTKEERGYVLKMLFLFSKRVYEQQQILQQIIPLQTSD